jgi:hypothetical protein
MMNDASNDFGFKRLAAPVVDYEDSIAIEPIIFPLTAFVADAAQNLAYRAERLIAAKGTKAVKYKLTLTATIYAE